MKKIIFTLLIILVSELLFNQCANITRPTGGPKDTIPPSLLISQPLDQTINFTGKEITLYFDEFINADKLRQKLILTPNTDITYKHIVKKRDLVIKFESDLADSTTYTLNFFDGVTDITEKSPVENLILAFSTGTFIDSLRVIGTVRDLFTNQPREKTTVGLYYITDTLDVFIEKPYYFVTTSKNGSFEIKNIKSGKYMMVAFQDKNGNLKIDEATEAYSFKSDTIIPQMTPDSAYLYQIQVDASPLNFISARPSGLHFDARYNKIINNYTASSADSTKDVYHSLNEEKDAVKFYNPGMKNDVDSTEVIITVADSLKNSSTDTVYMKFRQSSRKAAPFTYKMPTLLNVDTTTTFKIEFNKPVKTHDSSFLSLPLDTLYSFALDIKRGRYNHNRTAFYFESNINEKSYNSILDSLLTQHTPDTTIADSTNLFIWNVLNGIPRHKMLLKISKEAFFSIESDTAKAFDQVFEFTSPDKFGTIILNLTTDTTSYFVQLLDQKKNVVAQKKDCKKCKYSWIKPGKYSFRVLIDNDKNGTWDIGNIREFIEPETIIHFSEESELRSNWTLELDYSF